jgi:hypothetical protein
MLLLKIVLLPFVLMAAVFLAMITHISALTLHHRLAWEPTTATVLNSETLCEVTYQPVDAVLRAVAARGPCEKMSNVVLPKGGTTPRTLMGRLRHARLRHRQRHAEMGGQAGGCGCL